MNVLKNLDKLDWEYLSGNPSAVFILERAIENNPDKIDWQSLPRNPAAIHLIEQNLDKISWNALSRNTATAAITLIKHRLKQSLIEKIPSRISWFNLTVNPAAIPILEKYLKIMDYWDWISCNPAITPLFEKLINYDNNNVDKINWRALSKNPGAIHLLKQYPDKINWELLSGNTAAVSMLEWAFEKSPDKIDWDYLSGNTETIHILESHLKQAAIENIPDKINWKYLSGNTAAIPLLEKYPDKINWSYLSENPAAVPLFEKYPDKIYWHFLAKNPAAISLLKKYNIINWRGLSLNPKINELCFWDTGLDSFGKPIDSYFNFYEVYRDLRIVFPKGIVVNILKRIHL